MRDFKNNYELWIVNYELKYVSLHHYDKQPDG